MNRNIKDSANILVILLTMWHTFFQELNKNVRMVLVAQAYDYNYEK